MKYLPMLQMVMATILATLQTIKVLNKEITSYEYALFVMVFMCVSFLFTIYNKVNKS